jgi:glycosyltransferase involved in cell wall biosynthesis
MESIIYYDFSGVFNWPFPHLTGIQRVESGIYKGLKESAITLQPIFFDLQLKKFYHLQLDSLPPVVRNFINVQSEQIVTKAPKEHPIKTFLKKSSLLCQLADIFYSLPLYLKLKRLEPKAPKEVVFYPNDILLSCSASFSIPGHSTKLSQLHHHEIKIIRIIYDLIPTLKPQWVIGNIAENFRQTAIDQLLNSELILTISEFSKKEIHRFSTLESINPAQVDVIRLADNLDQSPDYFPNKKPHPNPFFLCVCTIDPRKNHKILYDAWQLLSRKYGKECPQLYLVGLEHLLSKDLLHFIRTDPDIKHVVKILNNVSDIELISYYQNCIATIYPSFYEGWGLPVAESLGYGKICLSSNASSMQEIAPELTEFFDPYNVYELIALVEKCWQETEWRTKREKQIRSHFQPTTWKDTVQQIIPHLLQSNSNG